MFTSELLRKSMDIATKELTEKQSAFLEALLG
jgi:hypothetical protein